MQPFGVQILLADPYATPEVANAHGATLTDLDTLLRHSDIVSLHAPVTEQTIGMLGAAQFAAVQDGALFVNTARARLIDSDALLSELQSGRISALIDVTEPHEPLPTDSPFFQLENCVVLPHMAAVTRDARLRQSQIGGRRNHALCTQSTAPICRQYRALGCDGLGASCDVATDWPG
jgi:phosphoglycerate dehydrogenase-like enzyme